MAEAEQLLIFEIVKRISPDPDDILTPEDISDIMEARAEYERGETVNINDIDWD